MSRAVTDRARICDSIITNVQLVKIEGTFCYVKKAINQLILITNSSKPVNNMMLNH